MATAAVMAGSAVLGAASSRSASKKAASAAKAGTDAQLALGRESNALTEKMANQARGDVNRLFGQREQNTRAGIQSGMELMGRLAPAQLDQMNQGNMNAQNMLAGSLQQQNNALLGNAVDYSQYQPRQTTPVDMGIFDVPAPNYTFADGSNNFTPAAQTQPQTQYPSIFTPNGGSTMDQWRNQGPLNPGETYLSRWKNRRPDTIDGWEQGR